MEVTPMCFGDKDVIVQTEHSSKCEAEEGGQETWELTIIQRRLGIARQSFSSFNEPS